MLGNWRQFWDEWSRLRGPQQSSTVGGSRSKSMAAIPTEAKLVETEAKSTAAVSFPDGGEPHPRRQAPWTCPPHVSAVKKRPLPLTTSARAPNRPFAYSVLFHTCVVCCWLYFQEHLMKRNFVFRVWTDTRVVMKRAGVSILGLLVVGAMANEQPGRASVLYLLGFKNFMLNITVTL